MLINKRFDATSGLPWAPSVFTDAAITDGPNNSRSSLTDISEFSLQLLSALNAATVRSNRSQADLTAALRRAGIVSTPSEVEEALCELEGSGCISNLVPLYDGGVLLTVTRIGADVLRGLDPFGFVGKLDRSREHV